MSEYIPGYGPTDSPRRPLSSEQYAIALTSLNNLLVIAMTTSDLELHRAAIEQMRRLANEMYSNGLQETWHIDTQAYTVGPKK